MVSELEKLKEQQRELEALIRVEQMKQARAAISESEKRYAGMGLVELNEEKNRLSAAVTALNRKLNKRYVWCKENGIPKKEDSEVARLKSEIEVATKDLADFKELLKVRRLAIAAKEKEELARISAATVEMEESAAEITKRLDSLRPEGMPVYFSSEFKGCGPSEKRLVMLMAREIGQKRYQELRQIAYWDAKHKRTKGYPMLEKVRDVLP